MYVLPQNHQMWYNKSVKKITRETYAIYLRHARPYWIFVALIIGSVIASGLTRVAVPLFYRQFFNVLSGAGITRTAGTAQQLTHIILIFLGLEIASWIFHRIGALASDHFQPRVQSDLLNTCFAYLHEHSYGFFSGQFIGSLVRKANRLSDAFEGISDRMFEEIIPTTVRVCAIIAILLYSHRTLGLILLAWVAIYLVINYAFAIYKLPYDRAAAEINSRVTAHLADTLTNNVNIKVFASARREYEKFRALTDKQFRVWKHSLTLNEHMNGGQAAMMIAVQFLVLFMAIRYWIAGQVTLGDFALIQAYLIQLFDQLWNFGRVIRRMYKHLADAEEMVEIFNTPLEIEDKPAAQELSVAKGGVEFRNVNFTYNQTRTVLKNFNLQIAPGERVGLVGISGAGKSTIAALLLRFFDVTAGGIYIDGHNISDATQTSLRSAIGYVPQDPILFHRSLYDNIAYGNPDAPGEQVLRAAHLAHCDEFIERLPQKYDTLVGERGIKLSGGERQRVAIARAILKNAPILVMDEATSSLDSHAESIIQDALENLMAGKTTIVIAHRLSTIIKMDRIIVIHKGAIKEEGTHRELIEAPAGLYKKLWNLQAGGFLPRTHLKNPFLLQ